MPEAFTSIHHKNQMPAPVFFVPLIRTECVQDEDPLTVQDQGEILTEIVMRIVDSAVQIGAIGAERSYLGNVCLDIIHVPDGWLPAFCMRFWGNEIAKRSGDLARGQEREIAFVLPNGRRGKLPVLRGPSSEVPNLKSDGGAADDEEGDFDPADSHI